LVFTKPTRNVLNREYVYEALRHICVNETLHRVYRNRSHAAITTLEEESLCISLSFFLFGNGGQFSGPFLPKKQLPSFPKNATKSDKNYKVGHSLKDAEHNKTLVNNSLVSLSK